MGRIGQKEEGTQDPWCWPSALGARRVPLQESGSKELSLGGSENGAFSLFFYIIKVIVCCKINPDKGEVSQAK